MGSGFPAQLEQDRGGGKLNEVHTGEAILSEPVDIVVMGGAEGDNEGVVGLPSGPAVLDMVVVAGGRATRETWLALHPLDPFDRVVCAEPFLLLVGSPVGGLGGLAARYPLLGMMTRHTGSITFASSLARMTSR